MISKKVKIKLTKTEVTLICNAAKKAWLSSGPKAEKKIFTWKGKRYQVAHTNFRLLVKTMDDEPVAERYD